MNNLKKLTNEQLLRILGARIKEQGIERAYLSDEEDAAKSDFIQRTWDRGFPYLGVWDQTGKMIVRVCLHTGKTDPEEVNNA